MEKTSFWEGFKVAFKMMATVIVAIYLIIKVIFFEKEEEDENCPIHSKK